MTKIDIINSLKVQFNLLLDMDQEEFILSDIRKGAELRGANLWVLIFAIIIASIGLNVNSPAVIIGAMLISPLMGPLMAIGTGLAINDFDLIKLAVQNLTFALIASLFASTIYFFVTPLDQAQTEILARTTPTIFDVFIAFAGGLAGMVGNTRKVKGNVLPGVAIATALMPPLCTAGYGIATGHWQFFFGAFYLFLINCVFIFLGTFLIVKLLKFHKKSFVDKALELQIRRYILASIAITVIPSTYLAYNMIHKSLTERRINDFLLKEITERGFIIIDKKIISEDKITKIEISAVGNTISEEFIQATNSKLHKYNLLEHKVTFKNIGTNNSDFVAIKSAIIEELYKNNEQAIKDKDQKISLLERELTLLKTSQLPTESIKAELKIHFPGLEELFLSSVRTDKTSHTILLAYIGYSLAPSLGTLRRAKEWLKIRTGSQEIKLISERVAPNHSTVSR